MQMHEAPASPGPVLHVAEDTLATNKARAPTRARTSPASKQAQGIPTTVNGSGLPRQSAMNLFSPRHAARAAGVHLSQLSTKFGPR